MTQTNELSFEQVSVKEDSLKIQQKENLPKILKAFSNLGFEVVDYKQIPDGWLGGFTIFEFVVKDKRDCPRDKNNTYNFVGSDDNLAIYKIMPSGGKALFKNVEEVA